ncbi:MAG: crosslink repair DNA glycosylase YcaQ family protein [Candidatus Eisenbacteria bacterium]|uniref:YcaQ family DNA glycosylase n=1 Tax=Eiseniibacteriota bacterium TaxID=2212470 RepID=A0A956RP18_UNCEI|nr:YcaQ family DNA glycosylase [Candidatus Eisenbacteria bacterium]
MKSNETLSVRDARRLALCVAGLLNPRWTSMPTRATGRGKRARESVLRIIDRFGYLQLDTVSVAGARSHALVLLSRLPQLHPELGEELLRPGEPLFEYWGHEACWIPLSLYPHFEFRRKHFALRHEGCRNVLRENRGLVRQLRSMIRDQGPVRSLDLEGKGTGDGWWGHKPAKRVAIVLWLTGELAIRERRGFQRTFDLAERVIPDALRDRPLRFADALPTLMLRALDGHGWATVGTLASTWRLLNVRPQIDIALRRLHAEGRIVPCSLRDDNGKKTAGWIRTDHLELAARLRRLRPDPESARVLSPFDPVLWDRKRVLSLFHFEQTLEIFKPETQRVYGYFCLPVLLDEHLVGRVDLRADRRTGSLVVVKKHVEATAPSDAPKLTAAERTRAVDAAVQRHADSLGLRLAW